jgi:N utilization substance protein B
LKNLAKYKKIIRTREYLVQAIYQFLFNHQNIDDIFFQFKDEHRSKNVDFAYFEKSLISVEKNNESIQNAIKGLGLKETDLELIDKSIMYFAINEFLNGELDGPLIIDESLRLSKKFSSPESYKFINTYLDKFLNTK